MIRVLCLIVVIAGLAFVPGCGGGKKIPPLAAVEGTVVDQDGNPLARIQVKFMPDPEKEVFGKPGIGETDDQGRFVLYYDGDRKYPGTAVGTNRVVLSDILSMRTSRDPDPVARRFHRKYLAAKSTDLVFEVRDEDGQSFEIKVDPPRR
jgi:hypothetical protein